MTGAGAFKKTQKAKARPHRERQQPGARKNLGILEKKKDYKLRANDYKSKRDAIKLLKQKAEFKNPDEYYFGMANAKMVDGEHTSTKEGLSKGTYKRRRC
jgi:U3 small nucleolar RNA-associated protein 11